MPKHSHEELDTYFGSYDQLEDPREPTPNVIASRTNSAMRRAVSRRSLRPNTRQQAAEIEHLETRQLLTTLSPEIDPEAVFFKTLETNGTTVTLSITSPADSSVISTHGYGGNITVQHPGGANALEVQYQIASGNTNMFGVMIESANQKFSEHYYYTGGQLHPVYSEAWSLHPQSGPQAWADAVPRISAPGNIPEGTTITNPAMQIRLENGVPVMDLVTPDSQTLIVATHHPNPTEGKILTQYVLEHGEGGFVGTLPVSILNEAVNNQDSGGRTFYMISTTGNGVVQDAVTVVYSNQSRTFTKVANEIPFTLPEVTESSSSSNTTSSDSNTTTSQESSEEPKQDFSLTADNWTIASGSIDITDTGAYITPHVARLVSNERYTVAEAVEQTTEITFTLQNNNSVFVAMFESDTGSNDRFSVEIDGEYNHLKLHKKQDGSSNIVHRKTGMPFNGATTFTMRVTHTDTGYQTVLIDENDVEIADVFIPFANINGTHQIQLRTAGQGGATVLLTTASRIDNSAELAEQLRLQQEAAPYVTEVVDTNFQGNQLPAGMSITPGGEHEYTSISQLRMHHNTGLQFNNPIVPTANSALYAESEFRIFMADTYQVNIHATNDFGSNGHSSMLSAEATINDNGDGFLRVTQTINGQRVILSQQGLVLDVNTSYKIVVCSNGENVFAELWSEDGVQLATLQAEVTPELQGNGYGSVQQKNSRVYVNSLLMQTINVQPEGVDGVVPAHVLRKLPTAQAIQHYMNEMSDISTRMSGARSAVESGAFSAMSTAEQDELRTQATTDLQTFAALQTGFTEYSLQALPNQQVDAIDLSAFNNAEIKNQEFHRQMLLTLENLGGTADVRLWKGKISNDALSVEEGVITSTGSGLSIDLAQAASFTTGVEFTVHTAEGALTATFYRGDEIIGTQQANDGDGVSFSDEAGVTGVVLSRYDSGVSLHSFNISGLSVTGTKNQNQTTVNPLNTIYNTQVSLLAAPDWTGGLSDAELKAIADNNRVGFSFYDGAWNPDWYKFARGTNAPVHLMFPEQSGAIEQHPHYVSPSGPKPIPSEFFQVLDSQRAIIAAGAPTNFLLTRLPYFTYGNQFGLRNGDSYSEVVPANTVDVSMNYLQARPIGTAGEGFVGRLPDPQRPERAVGTAKYHFNITNQGQKGGQVTVKVYAGYGSNYDLRHTYTDSLGAYETKGFIAPIDPQGSNLGPDGETILRGVYRIEVTYPDGTTETVAQGTTREHREAPKLGSAGDPNRANFTQYVRNTIDYAQRYINGEQVAGAEQAIRDYFANMDSELKPAVLSELDSEARRTAFSTFTDAEKIEQWGLIADAVQVDVFDLLPEGQKAVAFADLPLENRQLAWRSMTRAEKDLITQHSIQIAAGLGHAPDASQDGRFDNLARDQYFAKDEHGNDVVVLVVGDRHVKVQYKAGVEQTEALHEAFTIEMFGIVDTVMVAGVSFSEISDYFFEATLTTEEAEKIYENRINTLVSDLNSAVSQDPNTDKDSIVSNWISTLPAPEKVYSGAGSTISVEATSLSRQLETSVFKSLVSDLWQSADNFSSNVKRKILNQAFKSLLTVSPTLSSIENGIDAINAVMPDFVKAYAAQLKQEWLPLLVAQEVSTPLDRHQILLEAGYLEYKEPSAEKAGKLMVTINGHLQHIGDNPDTAGMEYATDQYDAQGYEVIHMRVGNAINFIGSNAALVYKLNEQILIDRLTKQGIFSDAPDIEKIGLNGYSWGGGTAVKLAHTLENSDYTDIPVHMALIDAVEYGYSGLVQPVSVRPPVESLFNRYQEHIQPSLENMAYDVFKYLSFGNTSSAHARELLRDIYMVVELGRPAHGMGIAIEGDDQDSLGTSLNHMTIDDREIEIDGDLVSNPTLVQMINFLQSKLDE